MPDWAPRSYLAADVYDFTIRYDWRTTSRESGFIWVRHGFGVSRRRGSGSGARRRWSPIREGAVNRRHAAYSAGPEVSFGGFARDLPHLAHLLEICGRRRHSYADRLAVTAWMS